MTPAWTLIRPQPQALGFLPQFFLLNDPRPAREQLQERYAHGGGVHPFDGFELVLDTEPEFYRLEYPGDPPMWCIAEARLREERLLLFQYSWLAIVQSDGARIITRVD